jgi:hypothetical protein
MGARNIGRGRALHTNRVRRAQQRARRNKSVRQDDFTVLIYGSQEYIDTVSQYLDGRRINKDHSYKVKSLNYQDLEDLMDEADAGNVDLYVVETNPEADLGDYSWSDVNDLVGMYPSANVYIAQHGDENLLDLDRDNIVGQESVDNLDKLVECIKELNV